MLHVPLSLQAHNGYAAEHLTRSHMTSMTRRKNSPQPASHSPSAAASVCCSTTNPTRTDLLAKKQFHCFTAGGTKAAQPTGCATSFHSVGRGLCTPFTCYTIRGQASLVRSRMSSLRPSVYFRNSHLSISPSGARRRIPTFSSTLMEPILSSRH
jgi:hypothetical protein